MKPYFSSLRPYLAPTIVALILIVIHAIPSIHPILSLQPEGVFTQAWRLFTTHLVHLNTNHLLMNVLALILVAIIFRPVVHGRLLVNVMAFAALFAALIPLILSDAPYFVGFSGITHGIVAYAGVLLVRQQNRWGFFVLAGLVAKLVIDMMSAGQYNPYIGSEIAYLAHLGGALGGVLAVPGLRRRPKDVLPS
ncbi:rhombosortase [Aliidiomarina halalkaliphila]|uniref:Rhombosortase n=1 Tax=Aliidiomarina halalkaliphila TaxID=2593535 RepID=A0A552X440_9GAMM|nr:rhombosortase [Aliidiomarina halalkaliphila]TRW49669.1 rhombosortase [Aliidiomarina halalkaliphila]